MRRFRHEFVESGLFEGELVSQAQDAQREREDADYAAWAAPREEAKRVINLAAAFISAIEALIVEIGSGSGAHPSRVP